MNTNDFNDIVAALLKGGCDGILCSDCLLNEFKWDGDESKEGRLCALFEDIIEGVIP